MDFYIVRHGVAAERGPEWPDDSRRPLTDEGRAKTREVARGLLALGVAPDAIFTSPYARARATADLIAGELSLRDRLRETRHLEPGVSPAALFDAIRDASPAAASVMVVGHEPDLGLLCSRLLAGDGRAVDIPLKKAGVVLIEIDGAPPTRRGTLRWAMAPGQLRLVGKAKE